MECLALMNIFSFLQWNQTNVIIVLCGKTCLFLNICASIHTCFAVKQKSCPCEKVRCVKRGKQLGSMSKAAKEFGHPESTVNDWNKNYDKHKQLSHKCKCVNNKLCCVNASSVSVILLTLNAVSWYHQIASLECQQFKKIKPQVHWLYLFVFSEH